MNDWWDDDPYRAIDIARRGEVRVAPCCDQTLIGRNEGFISQQRNGHARRRKPLPTVHPTPCPRCGGNLWREDDDVYGDYTCLQCGRKYVVSKGKIRRLGQ